MHPTTRFAFAAMLLASPALAADARPIDALTLLLDWQPHLGQRMVLTGCTITSATPDTANCHVKSKSGGTRSIPLDLNQLPESDLARALADCSFYVAYRGCRVRLSGEVAAADGDLRIINASVSWVTP